MSLAIRHDLAHKSNFGGWRNTSDIKYIVIHYTANKGDTALNNLNYFKNNANLGASSNYFVDETTIGQSVEDSCVAWHCGSASADTSKGGGKYFRICTNSNSISIELCNSYDSIPKATQNNAIELIRSLMAKYNIPLERVIRHFDVTGKLCPRPLCQPYGTDAEWVLFKSLIGSGTDNIEDTQTHNFRVGEKVLLKNTATQYNGTSINKNYLAKVYTVTEIKGDRVVLSINNTIIYVVNVSSLKGYTPLNNNANNGTEGYKVKINADVLNIRKEPTTNSKIVGTIEDKGVYTITETIGEWGKLKSCLGYINLSYTDRV